MILNECINIDEIKFLYNDNEDETKKNLINFIEYFYPKAKIKEEGKKIIYEVDDEEINNYYKIKTQQKCINFVKEIPNTYNIAYTGLEDISIYIWNAEKK